MKVLVTGVKGQLGYDVINELTKCGIEAVGVDIQEMDITDAASVEKVIEEADKYLADVTKRLSVFSAEDVGAESFKAVGLLWDELPAVSHAVYDGEKTKASKASKSGYVKLTFNFMVSQKLFVENEERYYPTDRFKALCENYFEEYRGRLYQMLGGEEDAVH